MPGKPWTNEDLVVLKSMYEESDFTVEEIASTLNRTYNATVLMASRQGWKRPITLVKYGTNTNPIHYNPLSNKMTIMYPVDIEYVLARIRQIKTEYPQGGP